MSAETETIDSPATLIVIAEIMELACTTERRRIRFYLGSKGAHGGWSLPSLIMLALARLFPDRGEWTEAEIGNELNDVYRAPAHPNDLVDALRFLVEEHHLVRRSSGAATYVLGMSPVACALKHWRRNWHDVPF
jgi:hypothetical protein